MTISSRKLIRIAKKWQRKAALGRKHITLPRHEKILNAGASNTSASSSLSQVAEKGHVVVYTVDQKRYSFPIAYLNNYIFRELFRMAEEEYGLPGDGPITIPCEAEFMDYLMSLVQKGATTEIEKAFLVSISSCRFSTFYGDNFHHPQVMHCF